MTNKAAPTIDEVVRSFQEHLHLPNPGIVLAVLAATVANLLGGDPVWILVVGPPSSGKTEVLDSLLRMPWIHPVSSFTEAGLLTGSPAKEGDIGATGGLLMHLGERGVLLAKDFTTVLSEHGSTRSRTFAVLREVYDGRFTRHLGTHGGRTFEWEGHAGFIGAVTEAIDTSDLGLMGERFLYYRLPDQGPEDDFLACLVADENAGHPGEIRTLWAEMVTRFLTGLELPSELPRLATDAQERLITLANIGARCRSTVVRDGFRRDTIELVPAPERSPRLYVQLRQMHAALTVMQMSDTDLWSLLAQIALDGIHRDRRRVLQALIREVHDLATATVGGRIGLPASSARRHLEDLTALGVLERIGEAPERWAAAEWVRDRWWAVGTPGHGW
jgi:hypothetical protein